MRNVGWGPFEAQRLDAGRGEHADVLAQMAVGDQEPVAVHRREVIRIDHAPQRLIARRAPVDQLQLPAGADGAVKL